MPGVGGASILARGPHPAPMPSVLAKLPTQKWAPLSVKAVVALRGHVRLVVKGGNRG